MQEVIIIGLVIGLILIAGFRSAGRNAESFRAPQTRPVTEALFQNYESAGSVFTSRVEARFFKHMQSGLSREFHLLTKVRLEDIIRVRGDIKNAEQRWHYRGRIKSRHVDFLVIDKTGRPVLAIEIDGPSHKASSRNKGQHNADALKDGLFARANIALIRLDASCDIQQEVEKLYRFLKSL